jgi:hypothetical protein
LLPDADEENNIVCTFCRTPDLQEISAEQMLAHWRKSMSPGTTPVVVMMQNHNYRKATEAIGSGRFIDMEDLMNMALAYFLVRMV